MTILKPKQDGPTPSEKLIEGVKTGLQRFARFMWKDLKSKITIRRWFFYICVGSLIKFVTAFFTFG